MPEATTMNHVMDGLMEIHSHAHTAMAALAEAAANGETSADKTAEAAAAIKQIDSRIHTIFMSMKDAAAPAMPAAASAATNQGTIATE